MFIRSERLANLLDTVDTLVEQVAENERLIKSLKGTVRYMERDAEEEALNRQYTRGIPLIEVVRALVAETGKELEIVKRVPAKVVLVTVSDDLSSD